MEHCLPQLLQIISSKIAYSCMNLMNVVCYEVITQLANTRKKDNRPELLSACITRDLFILG